MINKKTIWYKHLYKIKEPPRSKRIWKPHNSPHKLAIVLIEFRKQRSIKQVVYNNAHIYGGGNVSLVIVHGNCNGDFIKKDLPIPCCPSTMKWNGLPN